MIKLFCLDLDSDLNFLIFHGVHDAMYPNKVPMAFGEKNICTTWQNLYLHHTYMQVIFGIGILFMSNPTWVLVWMKGFFSGMLSK